MSTTVTYKDNTLTTVNNATKTLKTAGKYMEDDVILTDVDNTFVITLSYNDQTEMWEPDKTYAEIQAAHEAGKTIAVEATPNENEFTPAVGGEWTPLGGGSFGYETHEPHISSVYDSDGTIINVYFLTSNGIANPSTDILWLTGDATATPADVLSGKVFYDANGQQTGTLDPTPTLQSKSATPTESVQTITADSGYDGLSSVSVGAISSTYVGSGIDQRTSSDLVVSGRSVLVPAGYYSTQAQGTVAAGSQGTPTATKGIVSDHSIAVTPNVTNTAGYINGGTKTGTAVSVSASELVSGTYTISASGTHDVTNYASASVTAGGATASATKGTVSNHSVTVTPSVTRTAGYVTAGSSNGTAVTVSASELVSGTYTVDSSGTKDITNYASASVAAGSATASATKGTVSNHSVTVTPSVTRTAGWVSAGSANGTAVTVSASELVSGTKSITANGTSIDVTNYANVDVAVDNNFAIELTYNSQTGVWEPDCTFNEAKSAFINNKNIVSSINYPGTNSSFDGYNDLDDQIYYSTLEYDMQHYAYISKVYIWRSTGEINEDTSTRETRYVTTTATAIASDVANGKIFFNANGRQVGTASGGGGDSYTRTVIVPQQTVTPDSSRKFDFTYSSTFVDGEYYIVTLDGVEWLTTSETIWENEVVIGDSSVPWNASDDIYPFVMSSGTGYFTDTNQHILKVEHLEFVDGPSSGSATYRLDNIVPEQTIACTTFMQNNCYYGLPTYSSPIDKAKQYLVTFDGTEYVCEGYIPEANAIGVGDVRVVLTNAEQYLITPFFIEYQTSLGTGLMVRGSGTHTIKVDKLTFIDDGETFTTKTITQNGTYLASSDNADGYSSVTVNVSGGSGGTYQAKTNINPTTSSQTITPDSGYDALSSVQINAMPSGTAGTPTATKGSVSNHSITVTPSVTNTTGYITGSTKTGTAVTVSASELVSGSETKTANGTYNVTNLASLVVNIPIVTYHTSSSAPTSSQGSNGDLWLVTA